ncbi:hypothetical protein EV183_005151 [Coemansia sp. RSA 2336]|nr:hypothetical protein EV183_005151 [Coemansia sp. RSA 2336]
MIIAKLVGFLAATAAVPYALASEAEWYRGDRPHRSNCIMYEVKPGDYCYKIARDNGISYEQLLRQNPGLDCTNLQIGQSICLIPITGNWNSGWDDYDTGYRNLNACRVYVVKEGDLCSRIAERNGLTFAELNQINEKALPRWDMRIQVFCDLARYYGKLRFTESSDERIDQVDFAALANYFQTNPIPESSLSRKVGMYCSISINVSDHPIDPSLLEGLGLAEKPLQQLIQHDASTLPPRKLPGELIAAWTSLPAFISEQEGLDIQPLFDQEKIALCLHGGSYVMGSPGSHRKVIGEFSQTCKLRCLAIDYRLAPLHPFPAQLHDALIAYFCLLNRGFQPKDIVLVGDSAGGHLCIDLVLALRHISSRQPTEQSLLPRAICLLSPMPGVVLEGESLQKYEPFDYLSSIPIEWPTCPLRLFYKPGTKYTPEYQREIRTPLLSPIYGDLTGFPPTIIQAGSKEILLDDMRALYLKFKQDNPADRHVVWEEYPDMVHVFHRFLHRAEATQAFQSISEFLQAI